MKCPECHTEFKVPSPEEVSGQLEIKATAKQRNATSEYVGLDDIKCPICGDRTRLRTRKKDSSKFYVCVNYPHCKGRVKWENEFEDEFADDRTEERPAARGTHDRTRQQTTTDRNQSERTSSKPTKRKGGISFLEFGCFVISVISLCVLVYYWLFFDTSVAVPGLEAYGVSRVNNLGLMQQQQNGIIVSGIFAALGIAGMVISRYVIKKK